MRPLKYNKWFAWILLFVAVVVAILLFLLKLPSSESVPSDEKAKEADAIKNLALVGVEFSVQIQAGKKKNYKPIAVLKEYYLAKEILYFKLNQQGYVLVLASSGDEEKHRVIEESLLVEENAWTPFPKESINYKSLQDMSARSVCFLAFPTLQSLQSALNVIRSSAAELPSQAGCLIIESS